MNRLNNWITELRSISIRPAVLVFRYICVCIYTCVCMYVYRYIFVFEEEDVVRLPSFWKICSDFYEKEFTRILTEIPLCGMEECSRICGLVLWLQLWWLFFMKIFELKLYRRKSETMYHHWPGRDSSEQIWREILVPCPGIEPG